jgi:hypothetical protein
MATSHRSAIAHFTCGYSKLRYAISVKYTLKF